MNNGAFYAYALFFEAKIPCKATKKKTNKKTVNKKPHPRGLPHIWAMELRVRFCPETNMLGRTFGKHFVYEPVLFGFARNHPVVAVRILPYLVVSLVGVARDDVV